MSLDQQTANGEYSKYKVKQFSFLESDKKTLENEYGDGLINFNHLNKSKISNNGEFELKNPIKISELKLSAFFEFGI